MTRGSPPRILPVRFCPQQQPLSCEAACVRMALEYFNLLFGEDAILQMMRPTMCPRLVNVWDDPDERFVGCPNGVMCVSGYGIHARPVARIIQQYLPKSFAFCRISHFQIRYWIFAGYPIILWCTWQNPVADHWVTPEGKVVHVWRGCHVRLLFGYDDTHYHMMDPLSGEIRVTGSELFQMTRCYDVSGVVVMN